MIFEAEQEKLKSTSTILNPEAVILVVQTGLNSFHNEYVERLKNVLS